MKKFRIGSRESRLAVIQSEMVMDYIRNQCPEYEPELVTMKTTGDKILDRTLDKIGGKGLFVKELDAALLDGRSDLSVHSLKDMPAEIPTELPLIGFSKREDPQDVLVLPDGVKELDFFQTGGMFESAPDVAAISEIVSRQPLTDSWKCTDTSGKTDSGVLCNDSGSSRIKTTD